MLKPKVIFSVTSLDQIQHKNHSRQTIQTHVLVLYIGTSEGKKAHTAVVTPDGER